MTNFTDALSLNITIDESSALNITMNETSPLNITMNETSLLNQSESTPPSIEDPLLQIGFYVSAMELNRVQTYIIPGIGLPSNLASVITLLKMRPLSSSTVFLSLLAIMDFGYLFWDFLFAIFILHIELYMSAASCRLYFYFGSVMMQTSMWLMVAVTFERFMAVWLPLKVANICTVRRAVCTCVIIVVCVAALDIPYTYIPYSFQIPSGQWYCAYHPNYAEFISKWTFVDASIYFIIPWPILAVCNAMIIIGLRISVKRKQRLTNSSSQGGGATNQHISITVMLVTASVVSFLLVSPNMIYFLYANNNPLDDRATPEQTATRMFVDSVVYFLANLNHAINFWLYVISGSRFRRAFFGLLRCRNANKAKKYENKSKTTGVTQVHVSQKLQETEN